MRGGWVLFIDELQRLRGAGWTRCWWSRLCQRPAFAELSRRMKGEDVKADEKVEEENFQQNTALPQIYPCVCLHTTAYHKINAMRPQQLSENHPHLWQMLWNETLKIEHTFLMQETIYSLYIAEHGPCGMRKHLQHLKIAFTLWLWKKNINNFLMKIDLLEAESGTGRWCCWAGCFAGFQWWSQPRWPGSLWFADGERLWTHATGSCQWCFPHWWRTRLSGSLA